MSKLAGSNPRSTGRICRAVAGLVVSAAALIALVAVAGPRDHTASRAPAALRGPDASGRRKGEKPPALPDVAARTFVSSYVSFLYGRGTPASVTPTGAGLYRQLFHARSTATPAELTRTLVVRDLAVTSDTATTATASAVVDDGASPPYAVTFNLSFSNRRWLVRAVRSGDR